MTIDRRAATLSTLISSLSAKYPCLVATTAAISVLSGLPIVDGISLVEGDRVLVKDQSDLTTNGIYVALNDTWTRASDAPTAGQFFNGLAVVVAVGTINGNKLFVCSTATTGGITSVSFSGLSSSTLSAIDQLITGGANVSSHSLTTGNITVDCGLCPLQYITNGGAFSITAPVLDGSCMLQVTNNASAGAITFVGFLVGATTTGDPLTTTNGQKFTISIWRINGTSGYRIAAHQ